MVGANAAERTPQYVIPLDIFSMRLPVTPRKCKDREVHRIITSHRHHLKTIGHAFPIEYPQTDPAGLLILQFLFRRLPNKIKQR